MRKTTVVLTTFFLTGTALSAQESTYRQGAWVALGVGGGLIDLDCPACLASSTSFAPGGLVRLGGIIDNRWVAGLELSTWLKSTQGRDARNFVFSFSAFFYPFLDSGFNLNGGLGGLLYRETGTGEDISLSGVVFRGGVGYDWYINPSWAISPYFTYFRATDLTGKRNRIVFITQNLQGNVLLFGLALTKS